MCENITKSDPQLRWPFSRDTFVATKQSYVKILFSYLLTPSSSTVPGQESSIIIGMMDTGLNVAMGGWLSNLQRDMHIVQLLKIR